MYYHCADLERRYPTPEYFIKYCDGRKITEQYYVEKITLVKGVKEISVWRREYWE